MTATQERIEELWREAQETEDAASQADAEGNLPLRRKLATKARRLWQEASELDDERRR